MLGWCQTWWSLLKMGKRWGSEVETVSPCFLTGPPAVLSAALQGAVWVLAGRHGLSLLVGVILLHQLYHHWPSSQRAGSLLTAGLGKAGELAPPPQPSLGPGAAEELAPVCSQSCRQPWLQKNMPSRVSPCGSVAWLV